MFTRRLKGMILILTIAALTLTACGPGQFLGSTLTPTPSPTPTFTPTSIPTETPTPTSTPTSIPTETPTPTPIHPWSGDWNAEADLLGSFTFSVSLDGKRVTIPSLDFPNFKCGNVIVDGVQRLGKPSAEIIDRKFTVITPLSNSPVFPGLVLKYEITIAGEFEEAGRHASGTWQVDSSGTICSGDWEAE